MKKVFFAQVGLTVAAGAMMFAFVNQSMGAGGPVAVQNLRFTPAQLERPRSLSGVVIPKPSFSPIVIPEGADEKQQRECDEAKKAADDRLASYNSCVSGYTTRYEAPMSASQMSAFMSELGITDANDFFNASIVAAKIARKCEATAKPSARTVAKEADECSKASASLDALCSAAEKALTAQRARRAKLEAELAVVNALIAANKKEVKDNSCGSKK